MLARGASARVLGLNEEPDHARARHCGRSVGGHARNGRHHDQSFHPWPRAQNGLLAALLAQQGLPAETSLDGPHGFANVLHPSAILPRSPPTRHDV